LTEQTPEHDEDNWLTLAEIAEELRLSPAAIRSWIAKGKLRATRAGQRKWLVRRSELERMLDRGDAGTAVPPLPNRSRKGGRAEAEWSERLDEGALEAAYRSWLVDVEREAEAEQGEAAYDWEVALETSRMAPPDARFPSRLRQIAQAAGRRAAVLSAPLEGSEESWRPVPGAGDMALSYELRPGGNRPGPKDAWDRFDRVVQRLGEAMEGSSAAAVADAFSDLAVATRDIADALEGRTAGGASGREAVAEASGEAESGDPSGAA
jgi:excisionase family DNA binding protein